MGDRLPVLRLKKIRDLHPGDSFEIHTAGGVWKAIDLTCVIEVFYYNREEIGIRHQLAREAVRVEDGEQHAFPFDWECNAEDRSDP